PPHWTSGGGAPLVYLQTQAWVIAHYLYTFFIPNQLSADTDWTLITNMFDLRILAGAGIIIALFITAVQLSGKNETKGISFGIAWFFIALAPTSSIFSFAEVLNDHRVFFPFIGLVFAVASIAMLILEKTEQQGKNIPVRAGLSVFAVVLLLAHAAGTHERNHVWSSGETLWKDVTEKSPDNGRGWMNYGLSLMAKSDYDGAIDCFNRGLKTYPYYSYLYINMGIAENGRKNTEAAEKNFRYALSLDSLNPESYYYYGDFLVQHERMDEAKAILEKGKTVSPQHEGINNLLSLFANGTVHTRLDMAIDAAQKNPTADNYVLLSLAYYNDGQYAQSAGAALKAAAINPAYANAWNNACAAYNKMGEFDEAIAAGQKAVQLAPTDALSKNNLAFALSQQAHFTQLEDSLRKNPSYTGYVSLSMQWYAAGNYGRALAAGQQAVKINPGDATGWNNICAYANALHEWDIAIDAGKKALKIKPDFQLAKNNLDIALKGKGTR
ncbi:MAG TPA: tetratricopeptide repeat protein, partial [Bacteroidia bacterium]|nr:tetratricopeptide repeat protein [Bacteroidia bacterium]